MNINLYKITNINKKINKTLGTYVTLEGTLKEDCKLLDPVIKIAANDPPDFNYAYIPDFNRYYFVEPPTAIRTGIWELTMHVDVLYTYRDGIMSAPCIVAKSSSNYNLYLNDPNYKCYQNPHIFSERFPSGFNLEDAHFVMTLFGDKVLAE